MNSESRRRIHLWLEHYGQWGNVDRPRETEAPEPDDPMERLCWRARHLLVGGSNRPPRLLVLGDTPCLYYPSISALLDGKDVAPPRRVPSPGSGGWYSVGPVESLLQTAVEQRPLWGSPATDLLPLLAGVACTWAERIVARLGNGRAEPAEPLSSASFEKLLRRHTAQYRRSRSYESRLVQGCLRAIRPPQHRESARRVPAMAWFSCEGGQEQVAWLDSGGRILLQEAASDLIERVARAGWLDCRLGNLSRAFRVPEKKLEEARSLLRRRHPGLDEAVATACRRGEPVGYLVGSGKSRGLPADVRLSLHPAAGAEAKVRLLAVRACEEFVLESQCGSLFYFPPTELAVEIGFRQGNPLWEVGIPLIRLPAGSPSWIHPYTGPARPQIQPWPFSGTPEPLVPMTEAGRRFVGRSGDVPYDCVIDICVEGAVNRMNEQIKLLRKSERRRSPPDPFPLVLTIWEVMALGLTCGHVQNDGYPRVSLDSANMPYCVDNPRSLVGSPLADRIFSYDPNRPIKLR